MFLVVARFARWVDESITNVRPGMVQDSSVESVVQAYAPAAHFAWGWSDHSSANASYTLRAGPDGLVPTENILGTLGTLGTLATLHTHDGKTCGDSFTRESAAADICFGCSSCTSSL